MLPDWITNSTDVDFLSKFVQVEMSRVLCKNMIFEITCVRKRQVYAQNNGPFTLICIFHISVRFIKFCSQQELKIMFGEMTSVSCFSILRKPTKEINKLLPNGHSHRGLLTSVGILQYQK